MRSFSDTTKALLASGHFGLRVIARLVLPSGTWGASDAPETFTFGGQDYAGFDQAFTAEVDPSAGDGRGANGRLKLSATDPEVLATFFAEDYRARPVTAGVLVVDPVTGLPSEEIALLDARLDNASVEDGAMRLDAPGEPVFSTLTVEMSARSVDMDRASNRVRSDEDQRTYRDENDGFFKDVRQLPSSEIAWGQAGPMSPTAAGATQAAGSGNLTGLAKLFGGHTALF